jgi:hypothetical protein
MEWTIVIALVSLAVAGGIGFLAGLATFGLADCFLRRRTTHGAMLDSIDLLPPLKPGKVVFYGPEGDYLRTSPVSIHGLGRLFELLDRGEVR